MMERSVEQWREMFVGRSPKDAAKMVLGALTHYMSGRSYEDKDVSQLANAIEAYMRMCNSYHRDSI
jgi:hypothetical protein